MILLAKRLEVQVKVKIFMLCSTEVFSTLMLNYFKFNYYHQNTGKVDTNVCAQFIYRLILPNEAVLFWCHRVNVSLWFDYKNEVMDMFHHGENSCTKIMIGFLSYEKGLGLKSYESFDVIINPTNSKWYPSKQRIKKKYHSQLLSCLLYTSIKTTTGKPRFLSKASLSILELYFQNYKEGFTR